MSKNSIHELDLLAKEDKETRARERIIEMFIETGHVESILAVMWKDLDAKQRQ